MNIFFYFYKGNRRMFRSLMTRFRHKTKTIRADKVRMPFWNVRNPVMRWYKNWYLYRNAHCSEVLLRSISYYYSIIILFMLSHEKRHPFMCRAQDSVQILLHKGFGDRKCRTTLTSIYNFNFYPTCKESK